MLRFSESLTQVMIGQLILESAKATLTAPQYGDETECLLARRPVVS